MNSVSEVVTPDALRVKRSAGQMYFTFTLSLSDQNTGFTFDNGRTSLQALYFSKVM